MALGLHAVIRALTSTSMRKSSRCCVVLKMHFLDHDRSPCQIVGNVSACTNQDVYLDANRAQVELEHTIAFSYPQSELLQSNKRIAHTQVPHHQPRVTIDTRYVPRYTLPVRVLKLRSLAVMSRLACTAYV